MQSFSSCTKTVPQNFYQKEYFLRYKTSVDSGVLEEQYNNSNNNKKIVERHFPMVQWRYTEIIN